ncbi:unnamed protein product, partial [Staurois parvus]
MSCQSAPDIVHSHQSLPSRGLQSKGDNSHCQFRQEHLPCQHVFGTSEEPHTDTGRTCKLQARSA